MSAITLLLDTLFHSSLGKQVESPSVNGPVRPVPVRQALLPDLSPGGRVLAGTIATLSSSPPVIRPGAALLRHDVAGGANLLSERLQTSIRESGLFYESHLAKWFRGEMSTEQLNREPQARFPHATPGEGFPAAEPRSIDSNEALRSVLRGQLDLLAAPVLRWEGDVWSGVFMALMIHAPMAFPGRADSLEREEQGGARDPEGEDWRADLTLDIEGLGRLRVNLRLGKALVMSLHAASPRLLQRLEAGRQDLHDRLKTCGFEEVNLTLASDEAVNLD